MKNRMDIFDGFYFIGAALVAGGAWWIYEPAGLIVGGCFLVLVFFAGRRSGVDD